MATILIVGGLALLAAVLTLNRDYRKGDPKVLPAMIWLGLGIFCLVKGLTALTSGRSLEGVALLLIAAVAANKFVNRFSAEAVGCQSGGLLGGWQTLTHSIRRATRTPIGIVRGLLRRLLN